MKISEAIDGPEPTIDDKLTAIIRAEPRQLRPLFQQQPRARAVDRTAPRYCPMTMQVRPAYKLMQAVGDLETEADLCNSALYMNKSRQTGRWMLSCKGCAEINLGDFMPPREAAIWMIAAEKVSQQSNGMQLVSLWRIVPGCEQAQSADASTSNYALKQ